MKLIIEDDEGHKTTVPFVRDEITVGREDGNTIRLTERNVSRRHARFFKQAASIWVEDLKSFNGIKVNGDRIEGKVQLHEGDLVQIGDFDLAVQPEAERAPTPPSRSSSERPTVQMSAIDPTIDGPTEAHGTPLPDISDTVRSSPASIARMKAAPAAAAPAPAPAPEGVDVPTSEAPRVVIVSTELAGREFACIRSVLTLGRGDACDIVINHRSLADEHCRLWRDPSGQWKVTDLSGNNALQVNGQAYAGASLRSGDVIAIGHVQLRFVAPGEDYVYVPEGARKSALPMFAGAALGAALLGGGVVFAVVQMKHKPPPPAPVAEAKPAPSTDIAPPAAALQVRGLDDKTPDAKPAEAPKPAVAETKPAPVEVKPPEPPKPEPKPVVAVAAPKPEPKPEPAPVAAKEPPKPAPAPPKGKEPKGKKVADATPAPAPAPAAPTPQELAEQSYNQGLQAVREGDADRAIPMLRDAVGKAPAIAKYHKAYGMALAQQGQLDKAAEQYEQFLKFAPPADPARPAILQALENYKATK